MMAGLWTGDVMQRALGNAGVSITAWRWRYMPSLPRPGGQFLPHRDLAGARFDDEPTSLTPADGQWYPLDHKGDLCDSVPELRIGGRFASVGDVNTALRASSGR